MMALGIQQNEYAAPPLAQWAREEPEARLFTGDTTRAYARFNSTSRRCPQGADKRLLQPHGKRATLYILSAVALIYNNRLMLTADSTRVQYNVSGRTCV